MGTNLIVNGDFVNWTADDPDDWDIFDGDVNNYVTENPVGAANLISTDGANPWFAIGQQRVTKTYTSYTVQFDAVVNSNRFFFQLSDGVNTFFVNYYDVSSHYILNFRTLDRTVLLLRFKSAGICDFHIDNVGIYQMGAKSAISGTGMGMTVR